MNRRAKGSSYVDVCVIILASSRTEMNRRAKGSSYADVCVIILASSKTEMERRAKATTNYNRGQFFCSSASLNASLDCAFCKDLSQLHLLLSTPLYSKSCIALALRRIPPSLSHALVRLAPSLSLQVTSCDSVTFRECVASRNLVTFRSLKTSHNIMASHEFVTISNLETFHDVLASCDVLPSL